MELNNSKILVIGGAGFIGSFVVKELLKHNVKQVVIFDNFSRGSKDYIKDCLKDDRCHIYPNGGEIRDIDLLNDAMSGIDYVIHLAAMWLLHCKDFPRTAFHVNIEGTFNILEACVKNKIKKIIFSSSASVYGDAIELPMKENHPFNNRNFYGATKIACESMFRAFFDRYGLSYVGLRYMNVYGPHQDQFAAYSGVIPTLLNKIDKNETPVINGDGKQSYDFIYVEDVAKSNILALKANANDGFYNIGTGIQTSIKVLCDIILKFKESKLQVKYKPYSIEDSRRLVQNRIGCTKKSKREIGFTYSYSLVEGLKKLIEWRDNENKHTNIKS